MPQTPKASDATGNTDAMTGVKTRLGSALVQTTLERGTAWVGSSDHVRPWHCSVAYV